MFMVIGNVLSDADLALVRGAVGKLDFVDGRSTAGRFAATVKANEQATATAARDSILELVRQRLLAHPVFASAARPLRFAPMLVSRYRHGMEYGLHVDDAIMGGTRTDLSFTLAISDPADYDGADLIVEDTFEPRAVRLNAGDLVLYPSTTLHRVAPVTRGERLAVVGWVTSQIRDCGQREMLFDLDRAVNEVFAREGKSALFDTLAKTRSNLIRMWAEV